MNLFKMFRQPDPIDIAVKQLRLAQLQLLEACGAREAAQGHVTVLETRIRRLQQTVEGYAKNNEAQS
jgi:hypothetical protein